MNRLKYRHNSLTTKEKLMGQQFNETTVNAVANQGAKIGAVWLSVGITSWTDAAAFLAFVLSALALTEYVWKKIVRPILVDFGYLKSAKKRIKLIEVEDVDTNKYE